jgi:ABC-type dipeptide/oligopeptide/nickel transport system permease component
VVNYLVNRIMVSVVVLFGISVLLFTLLQALPGDPVEIMIDPLSFSGDRDAAVAAMRTRLGLDQPLPVQYASWMNELLRGNLGFSIARRRPVAELMLERLFPTLRLMGAALFVAILLALPAGLLAALRNKSMLDYGIAMVSLISISVPTFFVGLLGIYVFGIRLGVLPTSGMNSSTGSGLVDSLRHLVLPAGILGFSLMGPYVRYVRAAVLDTLSRDFLTAARAKGLSRATIIRRHIIRNSLTPLVTVIAIQIPVLFAGAVVIETIFAWPGLGRLAIEAILVRDYPILLAFVTAVSILVLVSNLLADISYALIDPRVRLR